MTAEIEITDGNRVRVRNLGDERITLRYLNLILPLTSYEEAELTLSLPVEFVDWPEEA